MIWIDLEENASETIDEGPAPTVNVERKAEVAETEAPEAEAAEPTLAEVAAAMGWTPREKFRGSPDKWKPASEFVRATADINAKMAKEQREMRQTIERMASTSAAIVEQQVAERVAAAHAKFEAAVDAGDKIAARAATREIDRLEQSRHDDNPEADFARDNPWYGKDEDATALAIGVSNRLAAQGRGVSEQLEAARDAVRRKFPELTGDARQPAKAPPVVNPPTTRSAPSNRAKGVADLPPGARKAAEDFARKVPGMTVDAYAKTYWADRAKDEAA